MVIPAYNASAFIEDAIASCKMQDMENEVIVVDDGSTDDTAKKAKDARLIRLPRNYGAATALNVGVWFANSEYVAWLSADDCFLRADKLSRQVAEMERTGADWSYYEDFQKGATLRTSNVRRPLLGFLMRWRVLPFFAVMLHNPVNGSSLMFRKSAFDRLGKFKSSLRNIDADGELLLRWSAHGAKVVKVKGIGAFYRSHPRQASKAFGTNMMGQWKVRIGVFLGR